MNVKRTSSNKQCCVIKKTGQKIQGKLDFISILLPRRFQLDEKGKKELEPPKLKYQAIFESDEQIDSFDGISSIIVNENFEFSGYRSGMYLIGQDLVDELPNPKDRN